MDENWWMVFSLAVLTDHGLELPSWCRVACSLQNKAVWERECRDHDGQLRLELVRAGPASFWLFCLALHNSFEALSYHTGAASSLIWSFLLALCRAE